MLANQNAVRRDHLPQRLEEARFATAQEPRTSRVTSFGGGYAVGFRIGGSPPLDTMLRVVHRRPAGRPLRNHDAWPAVGNSRGARMAFCLTYAVSKMSGERYTESQGRPYVADTCPDNRGDRSVCTRLVRLEPECRSANFPLKYLDGPLRA